MGGIDVTPNGMTTFVVHANTTDGVNTGAKETLGTAVGAVGTSDGVCVGAVGATDGLTDGDVGFADGTIDGTKVGLFVGFTHMEPAAGQGVAGLTHASGAPLK